MNLNKIFCFSIISLALNGCFEKKMKIDPENEVSKRISVFQHQDKFDKDESWHYKPSIAVPNKGWASSDSVQSSYHPSNIKHEINKVKTRSIRLKTRISSASEKISVPVVKDGIIYVKGEDSTISSYDLESSKLIWSKNFLDKKNGQFSLGGGLFINNNILYASFGNNEVMAIDAETGNEKWRTKLSSIIRASPTYGYGKIILRSLDNRFYILNADTGSLLFTADTGGENLVRSSKSSAVFYDKNHIIVSNSSGMIGLIDCDNGEMKWSNNLAAYDNLSKSMVMHDISTTPILYKDVIYAASEVGNIVAIQAQTGELIWNRNMNNVENIWVDNESLFIMDEYCKLWHLNSANGKLRWEVDLTENFDKKSKEKVNFYGIILSNNNILVSSSLGKLLEVSGADGKLVNQHKIEKAKYSSPIIVDGKILLVSQHNKLIILESE